MPPILSKRQDVYRACVNCGGEIHKTIFVVSRNKACCSPECYKAFNDQKLDIPKFTDDVNHERR